MNTRDLVKLNASTGSYTVGDADDAGLRDEPVADETAAKLRALYAEIGRLRMSDPAFRAKVNAGIRAKWRDPAFKSAQLARMAAGMMKKYGG